MSFLARLVGYLLIAAVALILLTHIIAPKPGNPRPGGPNRPPGHPPTAVPRPK